nr:efflux RND transporter permease subunit [Planctomycetota bacterium]
VEGLDTVESIGSIQITGLGSDRQIYLRDIAEITRGYETPPSTMLRFNGRPAIGVGVSTVQGGNVVTMGNAVRERLRELQADTPIGIEIDAIYFQAEGVTQAVDGFVISLIQAILIVIGVLVFAMGLRSGVLIGAILLLTVLATFIVMKSQGISLERISLGALIIALGMLVDNAIVVTEGIMVKMQRGANPVKAAGEVVGQTMWPLLGATFVAILAFASLGASQDSTGEFCRSLYQVILYSLLLSWLLAVTVTPLFCVTFLKTGSGDDEGDPYGGVFFRGYRALLHGCIRRRWFTVGVMVVLLAVSLQGFKFVDQSFFPDSTTPQFTLDYWLPEGTDIRKTSDDLAEIEAYLQDQEGVESVATTIGQGSMRFMLTYAPEQPNTAYGQMIVRVDDHERIDDLIAGAEEWIAARYPDSLVYGGRFILGPGGGSDIEVRLRGPDPVELRRLSNQVQAIMRADPHTRDVRDDWRQKTKVLRPVIDDTRAARAGLTRKDVSDTLQRTFGGLRVGVYRENEDLIPIVARAPERERSDIGSIKDVQIWSPAAMSSIPMSQVVPRFETVWEDHIIERRNRMPTITPQCNASVGLPSAVLKRLMPEIDALELPPGYVMEWGGEYENSGDAQAGIASKLPIVLLAMVLIVLALFNAIKQPVLIWLTVPLAMIGVTGGLLVAGAPFGFMALLGLLSLIGMMIKNAVVLVDEIDSQIASGKERIVAVLDSGVSRLRPVAMAAFTTVLGMIPLLPDIFFQSLAVTIMAGLGFATVLTLLVVPTLYAIFFKIPSEVGAERPADS